ncbi:hypothetical protein [Brevibacillus reuszeri]|uniref:hypothetical protein n=1 Tax=Brevibacillus reuszeri TaxID=54915 RepID=UPI001F2EAB35|nr:hypothetical protein [Brevibacillus reuszeri]
MPGYQGGVNALIQMGALKGGIPEDELAGAGQTVARGKSENRKALYAAERAAVRAIREKTTVKLAHGVQYRYAPGMLFADLPSGRSLAYVNPSLEHDNKFDKDGITFYRQDQQTGKWVIQRTYGGKLVENHVQAITQDCLAQSLVCLDEEGYSTLMHVHDEAVLDVPIATGSVVEVQEIMSRPMQWAPELPLRAAEFECNFYQKD